jgi:CheY-like chemotaxis protein
MAAYLVKPVKADELQIAILAALSDATRQKQTASAATARPERNRTETGTPSAAAQPPKELRILLAEDNLVNQRVALHILRKANHSVHAVVNGREAVEALEREPFDLVLMDVQMPEMDGFEATDAIRTRERISGKHMPIVAMTAHAMAGDRERCLAAGMDEYISKPVHGPDLLRLLQKFAPPSAPVVAPVPSGTAMVAPHSDKPVFDRETALDRVNGEAELLDEVIELFLTDAPNRLAEVRTALQQGDPKRLQMAAHSLKGAAGYVGADRTSAQALKLEDLGRLGELSQAIDEYQLLEREIERLREAIAASMTQPQSVESPRS